MNTEEGSNHIDKLLYDSGLFDLTLKPHTYKTSFNFYNDTILITGAAGSMGRELTKQLINSRYKKLILIDNAESTLHELITDLEFKDIHHISFVLLDITDKESLQHVFATHKPTLIFHTAAYKHVPLMEHNPYQAIRVNILSTKFLADLSNKHKVEKFIFISTDKAVNPINTMGMSKKVCENYLNHLNQKSYTKFITTRFGNILGSNGSAIPLFKKQIEHGLPITITDKAITRYFISKIKASHLILEIASIKKYNSYLFTFNMGKPIKIINIIKRLLTCYSPIKKMPEIKIIGLRPGEKRHEDLISKTETLIKTEHPDIFEINQKDQSKIKNTDLSKLENISLLTPNAEVKKILAQFI